MKTPEQILKTLDKIEDTELPHALKLEFRAQSRANHIKSVCRSIRKNLEEAKELDTQKPSIYMKNPKAEAKEKRETAKQLLRWVENQLVLHGVYPIEVSKPTLAQIKKAIPTSENAGLVKDNLLGTNNTHPGTRNNNLDILLPMINRELLGMEEVRTHDPDGKILPELPKEIANLTILRNATLHHLRELNLAHIKRYQETSQEELNELIYPMPKCA